MHRAYDNCKKRLLHCKRRGGISVAKLELAPALFYFENYT